MIERRLAERAELATSSCKRAPDRVAYDALIQGGMAKPDDSSLLWRCGGTESGGGKISVNAQPHGGARRREGAGAWSTIAPGLAMPPRCRSSVAFPFRSAGGAGGFARYSVLVGRIDVVVV